MSQFSGRKRRRGSSISSGSQPSLRRRGNYPRVLTGENARAVAEHFKRYHLGATVASLNGSISPSKMDQIDLLAKHIHPDRVTTIPYAVLVILGSFPRVRMGREMVGPLPDVIMFG